MTKILKATKILLYVFCIVICQACTSTSDPIRYYRLSLDMDIKNNESTDDKKQIIIMPVLLSKILRQDGIVSQLDKNEVRMAHYHRWAEPLDEAISNALVKIINDKSAPYYFSKYTIEINRHAAYKLRLFIDKFEIRDDASVNLSGRYWLLDTNNTSILEHSFNIRQPLNNDGYSSAVEKLKQTVVQLAENILAEINKIADN